MRSGVRRGVSVGAHRLGMHDLANRQPPDQRLTTQLDREWERLRHDRRAISTVRSWAGGVDGEVAPTFVTICDLDDLVGATHRRTGEHGEHVLLALIALARHHELAGRIVVQRLLPGLVSASSTYRFRTDTADPMELAIGSLWISIHCYDHERRRRHVAASLISDALFKAFRQRVRRRDANDDLFEPIRFDDRPTAHRTDPLVEIADVLGAARHAGVPGEDLDLLCRLVSVGSTGVLAVERQVTTRTIRNHRKRAVDRVRDALGIVAAA